MTTTYIHHLRSIPLVSPIPTPTWRISPVTAKLTSQSGSADCLGSSQPPSLAHAYRVPVVPHWQLANHSVKPAPPPPILRGALPAFILQLANPEDKGAVAEGLVAEFEQYNSHLAGTTDVEYTGRVASSRLKCQNLLKGPAVERVRAADRTSPKDANRSGGAGAQMAKRQVRGKEREVRATCKSPKARTLCSNR